ncbi:hypothetical protein GCM10011316_26400 [Roseibium aquae]|uniref:histidine kinase n=1 Tax=Roseibium aquae TaxID=1323746 RepID=A0A916TLY5_9HYPH|nr:ATP-binding protein [Roseibium aquae]GGB53089.1 hypothetical protein GCM10011316_26400 [Roseibium aquae]
MDPVISTFVELGARPDIAVLAEDRRAAWVFSADGARVLWSNAAGAAFMGIRDAADLASLTGLLKSPARPHISRIAETGSTDRMSNDRLRFYRGLRVILLTCHCQKLELAEGRSAALIISADKGLMTAGDPLTGYLKLLAGRARSVFLSPAGGKASLIEGQAEEWPDIADIELEGKTARLALDIGSQRHPAIVAQIDTGERLAVWENTPLPASQDEPEAGQNDGLVTDSLTLPDPEHGTAEETPDVPDGPLPAGVDTADDCPGPDTASDMPAGREPFRFKAGKRPIRFAWKMDIDQRFTFVSDEFAQTLGPAAAAIVGKTWQEVRDAFGVDGRGVIAHALNRRDTWSGKTVYWPVTDHALRIPVDMAALPAFDRERRFEGYRGFGVCRTADAKEDPDGPFFLEEETQPVPAAGEPAGETSAASGPGKSGACPDELAAEGQAETPEAAPEPAQVTVPPGENPDPSLLETQSGEDTREADEPGLISEGQQPPAGDEAVDRDEPADRPDREVWDDGPEQTGLEAEAAVEVGAEDTKADAEDPEDAAAEIPETGMPQTVGPDPADPETGTTGQQTEPAPPVPGHALIPDNPERTAYSDKTAIGARAAALLESLTPDRAPVRWPHLAQTQTPAQMLLSEAASDAEIPNANADGTDQADGSRIADEPPAGDLFETPDTGPGNTAQDGTVGELEAGSGPGGESPPVVDKSPDAAPEPDQDMSPDDETLEDEDDAGGIDEAGATAADPSTEPAQQSDTGQGIASSAALGPKDIETAVRSLAKSFEVRRRSPSGLFDDPQDKEEHPPLAEAQGVGDPIDQTATALDETAEDEALPPAETVDGLDGPDPAQDAPSPETVILDDDGGKIVPISGGAPRLVPVDTSALSRPDLAAFKKIAEALGARFEGDLSDFQMMEEDLELEYVDPAPQPSGPIDPVLLDRLPIGIAIARDREILYANETLLEFLGYPSLAALSEAGGLEAIFAEEDETALPDMEGFDDTIDGCLKARLADGRLKAVDARMHSVPWNGGRGLMFSLIERPQAEPVLPQKGKDDLESARRLIAQMDTILETATDGVLVLSPDGVILKVNRSAEALFNASRADMVGESLLSFLAPESHRAASDYLDGLAHSGVASILNDGREVLGQVAKGGLVPLFMTIGRVESDGGDKKLCAVLRDITQWKTAEEELTEAKHQAENASSQKSDFLAKISHEIRTPLNAIIGFSEVMMDERFGPINNDRYKEYLKDIRTSGAHIMSLINDLLDLSKIEAGKMDLRYTAVSLNDVVRECVALMQPQANRERVIIRASLPDAVPNVVADARSVRQILLNLLSNAIKFNKSGGQAIVSTALDDTGEVVLRVRDTGAGMSASDLAAALEPFRQLHTSRLESGSGLGLPLTKALVEANRAEFRIESTPDHGTMVEIKFPIQRVLSE